MKICTKCKENKELSEFCKRFDRPSGYRSDCRKCCTIKQKLKYASFNNEEKALISKKEKDKRNTKTDLEKEVIKVKRTIKDANRTKEEKALIVKRQRAWISNLTIEETIARRNKNNERHRERCKRDINYRLAHILRGRLSKAIKNNQKTGSAVDDLGCSIEEFKSYIEKQFEPWMNWDNWGVYNPNRKTWHIDHINALANVNLSDINELRKACHYANLRPLLALDNIKKSNK